MHWKRTPEDRDRQQLGDDIRRAAGFMESIVGEAQRLDVDVPEGVVTCVAVWQGWHRSLASRRLDPPRG